MKTTMTFKKMTFLALFGAALAAPVLAQPGPGMGGMGGGPGMQNAEQGAGNAAQGPRGGRGMRFNQGNTRGWTLMTPEERTAHQIKMREVKTFDECKLVQDNHRSTIEARAKEKGVTLQQPRRNPCEQLKSRGIIK